jgi:hypothetical protein
MPDQQRPPLPSDEDEQHMIATIIQAATCGLDFPGWLARILARSAARLGSTHALLASRPGSWEAADLRQLLTGTVGEGDEYLNTYRDDYGNDSNA